MHPISIACKAFAKLTAFAASMNSMNWPTLTIYESTNPLLTLPSNHLLCLLLPTCRTLKEKPISYNYSPMTDIRAPQAIGISCPQLNSEAAVKRVPEERDGWITALKQTFTSELYGQWEHYIYILLALSTLPQTFILITFPLHTIHWPSTEDFPVWVSYLSITRS